MEADHLRGAVKRRVAYIVAAVGLAVGAMVAMGVGNDGQQQPADAEQPVDTQPPVDTLPVQPVDVPSGLHDHDERYTTADEFDARVAALNERVDVLVGEAEPTTTLAPVATDEPTTTEAPVATDEPTTTEAPVATDEPTSTIDGG